MQKIYIAVLGLALFLSACKKDTATTAFDASYSHWLSFKKASNNSYTFTAVRSSFAWANVDTETKITVTNGTITARDYVSYSFVATPGTDSLKKTVAQQWHEDKSELNTHGDGYWLLTLDDVYSRAKNEWLNVDPKTNEIDFETKNDGMISTAGYVPKNCADDCFNGINISEIRAL